MVEKLGAYELVKRIGAGGMADVFLAKGPRGVCVIKRPHAHLSANADFVRMFLDEASLLAQLNHPGIAQIFDLGQVNGVYYLAMEYVPGFDLMTISLEHERNGELMAPELCARIVADAAVALHYAHEAKGRNGQSLHIIHRDVSPHNILLSTAGVVKLIDFGVARAATATHRTQAGLVKGKYPYMSPEQITGQAIDRRVDIYALGLVLYELLTNVRAIAGNIEVEQIDNARAGRIRPIEQLRANVPMPLRQILGGCLHPNPEGRYPTAQHLKDDLEKWLGLERHVVGQEDLLRLFRVVAAEAAHLESPTELEQPRPTELDQPVSAVLMPESQDAIELGASSTTPSMKAPVLAPIPLGAPLEAPGPRTLDAPGLDQAATPLESEPLQLQRSRGPLLALSAIALVLLAVVGRLVVTRAVDAGPTIVKELPVVDAGTLVEVPPLAAVPLLDAGAEPDAEPEDAGTVEAPPADLRAAVVTVDTTPPTDVSIGKDNYGHTPTTLELAPGKYVVQLSNRKERFFRRVNLSVAPGDKVPLVVRARKGSVKLDVVPFGLVKLNGETVVDMRSVGSVELYEGKYTFEATLPEAKTRQVKTVDVKPDAETQVSFNLNP
jgi:serine/threonine-protein kinase